MALDEATLRKRLGTPDTTVLSSDEAAECLNRALRMTNDRMGQRTLDESLVTVADQQAYDFPFDVREHSIEDVVWHKSDVSVASGTDINDRSNYRDSGFPHQGYDGAAQSVLDTAQLRLLIASTRGNWDTFGGKLYLDPAPATAGDKIIIIYRKDFTLVNLNADLHELFWSFAVGAALEVMGIKDLGILEVTEGSQKLRMDGGKESIRLSGEKT